MASEASISRQDILENYLFVMAITGLISPTTAAKQLDLDLNFLLGIIGTRYLAGRDHRVPKSGNMHLAWEYAANPDDHIRFVQMLRVSPLVFERILSLIEDDPIFHNQSSGASQAPVETQLAVTLYRLGRYGNGASIQDVARAAGISPGSVENYTNRCFEAIERHQTQFVRRLSAEEKEIEKQWIDDHLGFRGLWREGWLMYDGTIVVLASKPALDGDAYFTRKSSYGLNVQIGNVPSNLRICDYSHGLTGSAHDAKAFEGTCASKYPDWLFDGDEFAWVDSAYPCTLRTMPVHKEPASNIPENAIYDKYVSHLRVRSEHCMGALKGRFQSLRGLQVQIGSKSQHVAACRWVTIAIILHNLIIDTEGTASCKFFASLHLREDEEQDVGIHEPYQGPETGDGKRRQLIKEVLDYREQRDQGRV